MSLSSPNPFMEKRKRDTSIENMIDIQYMWLCTEQKMAIFPRSKIGSGNLRLCILPNSSNILQVF